MSSCIAQKYSFKLKQKIDLCTKLECNNVTLLAPV